MTMPQALLAVCLLFASAAVASHHPPPPPPPSPLELKYQALLNATCGRVAARAPAVPAADEASFMQAYQQFNGTGSEAAVLTLAKQILATEVVQSFLALPDSFVAGGLDADMVLCAVLFDATPAGLAQFAGQGATELALVSSLLNNTLLMRDMLVAGGASGNFYGAAMAIYTTLLGVGVQADRALWQEDGAVPWDDRNQTTVLARLKLATALAFSDPIVHYGNSTTVDPIARYLNYERAYLAGDLDPAMEVLTVFELRWMVDSNAEEEDLQWFRTTCANYRPDEIAMGYGSRYMQTVHTEVSYGDPACASMPGVCTGHYWEIPAAGGECGPRAFFGRFARNAFGLPTWGVTQPGHAAMSSWSPEAGWAIQLGADWKYSWWGDRGGEDFVLETQCREARPAFQQVLRGGWVAKALGEAPVNPGWTPRDPSTYGKGGFWSALMLYAKKLATNGTTPGLPRPIGPSVVPTKVAALVAAWPEKWPTPNITTDKDGTIIIPGPAHFFQNRSAPVETMKSFDLLGQQLIHGGGQYLDPAATSISYAFDMPAAGIRYLTANITTWHMNTDLLLVTNSSATPITVPVYYTIGYWNETQPIAIPLVAGRNVLTFMRAAPAPIVIKEFFLYINPPAIPPPPKNYTPSPPPPQPDMFILVSDMTTCAKQGLLNVPASQCNLACESQKLTYTGAKPRVNMTDCFALTSGQYAGNCNFNSNGSAAICNDPPCTIYGCIAQQLCLRQG